MKTFWGYVGKKLGLPELEQRVDDVDTRMRGIEGDIRSSLNQFGDYKNKTRDELSRMRKDIDNLLDAVDALVRQAEDQQEIKRAKQLRGRLRNNKTRIDKARAA